MSDATKTNEAVKVAESATKESAKPKVSGKSEGYIAVVQVRGLVGVKASVRDTLRMLGLNRVNQCVLVKNSQSLQGMLLKVKDYATYGPVSEEVIKELISKRGSEYAGRLQDAKGKYSYSSFDYAGKKYKRCFKLNPPRKGYGRAGIKKSFVSGGALGNRGEKITDLIQRMI